LIEQNTVPVHVNAKDEANAELAARYLQVWTPTVHLLLSDGRSAHEHNGYLPPDEFAAELELGLAKADLRRRDFTAAAERFERLRDDYPTSHVAPEASYWAAVSRYNESGQADGLMAGWQKLRDRYPENIWRWKQSFYE
jgi:hypothetical protein